MVVRADHRPPSAGLRAFGHCGARAGRLLAPHRRDHRPLSPPVSPSCTTRGPPTGRWASWRPARDALCGWRTPFPSLAPRTRFQPSTGPTVSGIPGCANDPCQTGWPPNDIRAVANSDFLDANPSVRRLLEQVVIPLEDISAQNVQHGGSRAATRADIRRTRRRSGWQANLASVMRWITEADPEAVGVAGRLLSDDGRSPQGTLTVAARAACAPFVIYDESHIQRLRGGVGAPASGQAGHVGGDPRGGHRRQTGRRHQPAASPGSGLGGVAITESREEIVDFSLPVLDTGLTILVPRPTSRRATSSTG